MRGVNLARLRTIISKCWNISSLTDPAVLLFPPTTAVTNGARNLPVFHQTVPSFTRFLLLSLFSIVIFVAMVGPCIQASLPPISRPSIACMHHPSRVHQRGSHWRGQTAAYGAMSPRTAHQRIARARPTQPTVSRYQDPGRRTYGSTFNHLHHHPSFNAQRSTLTYLLGDVICLSRSQNSGATRSRHPGKSHTRW